MVMKPPVVILARTTKCDRSYFCLSDIHEDKPKCEVERVLGGELLFLKICTKINCSYARPFEFKYICKCPIHHAVFSKNLITDKHQDEYKRQHERVSLSAIVSIANTTKACEGDVVDVSFGGVAIERVLSNMLKDFPKQLTVVISFRGGNVKVITTPKWYKNEANGIFSTVGFKVIGSIDAWHTFVRRATGLIDNSTKTDPIDIWGSADTKYLYR